MPFWKNLKEGSDYFEALKEEPKVAVCAKRYVFGGSDVAQGACSPQVDPAVAQKRAQDEQQVAELVAKGAPAVRVVYEDGGQHQSFRESWASGGDSLFSARPRRNLGEVSRPEALAQGPREILMDEPAAKPDKVKPSTALAQAAIEKTAAKTADRTAKPVARAAEPEKPAPVVVAAAGADSPSLASKFAGLFGKTRAPAAPTAAAEEPAPAEAALAPPRRKAAATPAKPAAPAKPKPAPDRAVSIVPKPDSVSPAPERRAEAKSGLIPGSQPALPAATGFASN
jgi:hypothetical protein